MIGQNLGKVERVVRLILGIGLGIWVSLQPEIGLLELIVSIAALFLTTECVISEKPKKEDVTDALAITLFY